MPYQSLFPLHHSLTQSNPDFNPLSLLQVQKKKEGKKKKKERKRKKKPNKKLMWSANSTLPMI